MSHVRVEATSYLETVARKRPYQSNTPVIDLDGLLLIAACHIPEYHLGQLVCGMVFYTLASSKK